MALNGKHCPLCQRSQPHQHRVCECGDWWEAHADDPDGKGLMKCAGACGVCEHRSAPYDNCAVFRFSHMEQPAFLKTLEV